MVIKDIRAFRKYYKEAILQVNDPKRNEHFIGHSIRTNDQINYGFFELYHGDKQDINKFITPFLKMAQDWQAVYELLQNAYDSNSSIFALFFNEDYLLALNNGTQFTLEGIRSILNIGQSTKESKSNIGKFGVGFKIVHRLIGETDGRNELNKLNGPILFSWNKYSDLESLLNTNFLIEIEAGAPEFECVENQFLCKDDLPWLFKIMMTNFPCGPNDEILDLSYKPFSHGFSIDDLNSLKNCIKENFFDSNIYDINSLSQGTIIFLRLGKGKHKHLEEAHIKQGIGYSLSILNSLINENTSHKLEKVFLNDTTNPFSPADIQVEKLVLSENESHYSSIIDKNEEGDAPLNIEFLFGYSTKANDIVIKSNPNLYLYFPISDEIHNFNFIVHCNYFENLSNRTNLAEGDRNKKLFEILATLLIQKLNEFKKKDFNKYTLIYASILTSDWKATTNKIWVYESLLKPLIDFSKDNIPTVSKNFYSREKVRIKNTSLDILPTDFGVVNYEWFIWENNTTLSTTAASTEKLILYRTNSRNLIEDSSNLSAINDWLFLHKDQINPVLDEINVNKIEIYSHIQIGKNTLPIKTKLVSNLYTLKLFLFSDENYYSINDIKSQKNLLLLTEELLSINDSLISLGFMTCSFDQKRWTNIFNYLAIEFPYLSKVNLFFDYFTDNIEAISGQLTLLQLTQLISFFNNYNSPICSKIVIVTSEANFSLIKKFDIFQVYVTDKQPKLRSLLLHQLSKKYFLLNDEFEKFITNQAGIIKDIELYRSILTENLNLTELIDIIKEAGTEDVYKEYLEKITELILLEDKIYSKDSFEHKIFELLEKTKSDAVRNKIKIKNKNEAVLYVDKITYSNKVIFKSTDDSEDQYEVVLSKILPQYSDSSELIEKIIESFTDFDENSLRKNIFKVGKQKPKDEIVRELNTELVNSHQLAFVLLYSKFIDKNTSHLTNFKIKIKNGNIVPLDKKKYFIKSFSFIAEDYILNDSYNDIYNLLNLNENKAVFDCNVISIIYAPFLTEGVFHCHPFKFELNQELESQKQLFLSLYSEFTKDPHSNILIKFETTTWTPSGLKYSDDTKELLLGFNPKKVVFPAEYCINVEDLPDWIKEWVFVSDYQMRVKYLKALGVNTEESSLVQLRKYLINKVTSFPSNEELIQLATMELNYLKNTLLWVLQQSLDNSQVIEKTEKYDFYLQIFRLITSLTEYPLLKIAGLKSDNSFIFEMQNIISSENVYSISEVQKHSLISKGMTQEMFQTILNLSANNVFIYEEIYDSEALKSIKHEKLIIKKILNVENQYFRELETVSYQSWKKETKNLFRIFCRESESKLNYKISVQDIELITIAENEIDITSEGDIYTTGGSKKLPDLLKSIIGRYNFLEEHYLLYLDKVKNEPHEIAKIYDDLFTPPASDILTLIEEKLSSHFPVEEEKDFKKKLIELLNVSQSPWGNGYVFHFTHLENAIKIIKSNKLCSRYSLRPEDYHDSASGEQIHRTRSNIHNFARFYFRPHTPTQWHIEGLGRRRYADNPKCPVLIFFKIKVEDIFNSNPDNCYVSNGNLSSDWATYSKDYDFLKRFDFYNVYSMYRNPSFKTASQQEFLVQDYLDLTKLDYDIICRNSQDQKILLNLLGNEYVGKIKVDSSLYHNENQYIIVQTEKDHLLIFPSDLRNEIELKINISSDNIIKNIKGIISSLNYDDCIELRAHLFDGYEKIEVLSESLHNCEIKLIDEKQKEWLIYYYGNQNY